MLQPHQPHNQISMLSRMEGNINVIVKVKTKTDTLYIDGTVSGLGQVIALGVATTHVREYLRLYDFFEVTVPTGGIAVVPLNTANDADNATGTRRATYDGGTGTPFIVGEEITSTTGGGALRVGIITAAGSGATGTFDYVLKSVTDFANNDVCTGRTSGDAATINVTIVNVVAGYGTDIRVMTVDEALNNPPCEGLCSLIMPSLASSKVAAASVNVVFSTSAIVIEST